MIPELGLGDDEDLVGDEAGLEEQEAAHQEARVPEQVPVPRVRAVPGLSSVHHPVRLVQVLRHDGDVSVRKYCTQNQAHESFHCSYPYLTIT